MPCMQVRQAAFVMACIRHLRAAHSESGGQSPFRLAVVGYSMGGVVARAALAQLQGEPGVGECSKVHCL
jgi:hypothetical protein